jgi:hypothetical protein
MLRPFIAIRVLARRRAGNRDAVARVDEVLPYSKNTKNDGSRRFDSPWTVLPDASRALSRIWP